MRCSLHVEASTDRQLWDPLPLAQFFAILESAPVLAQDLVSMLLLNETAELRDESVSPPVVVYLRRSL